MQLLESDKLSSYWQLMRADKPIGTYLLLWPTLWGLLIAANGWPGLHITLVFVLGVVLMRAAGCVINDYADRKIDGRVKRTQQRPLVSGVVTEKEALQLFVLLCFIAFLLVLTLSWQTVALSFVALALAFSYPFMKRYTHLPQFVLGAAFSFGIPMAFMEISQSIPWWAWVLYVANLSWTVAYDTMYAIVDRDDDLKIGVKSTAILFGEKDKLIIGLMQGLSLCLLALVFVQTQLGIIAFVSLAVAAGLFFKQQQMIAHRDRDACFAAFLHNNNVGMVVTFGIALDLLFEFVS